MEHRMHVMILGTVLVVVAVAFVLTSNLQLVTEPGGYFRVAQRAEPTSADCYDTDGGANWYVQGATRYLNWSFIDGCTVDNTILYESYCESATQPAVVQHNCTHGCLNGACVK